MMRIGIDLGGTKIEIAVLDDDNAIRLRRRVPTPEGDYAATLDLITTLVATAEAELGARCSVGIGTPGSLSPLTGLVRNANSTCLNGQPLLADLSGRLDREVRIANDANCLALSEATDGAAAGASVVFAVILGTGVGGGIVVEGRLLQGMNLIAGEWGHNPLPAEEAPLFAPDGSSAATVAPSPCYCGRTGCIETRLSGPGMAAEHAALTGALTGQTLTPAEIAAHAEAGDALCEATMRRYESRLARALATVINLLDPDVIVLGGGLSRLQRLYRNVPEQWVPHVFSDVVRTRLRQSLHGDSSGVRGAAWLWPAGASEARQR